MKDMIKKMYKICKKKRKIFDFNESLYNLFFFIAFSLEILFTIV